MKKFVFFALMMCIFILSSCEEKPIECETDEELIDGVCEVIKTPFEQTFDRMAVLNNYTLDITIQQFADVYAMTLEVDQENATFEMDGQKEYYHHENGICTYYYPVGDGYRMEVIECGEPNASYDFFHAFEPSWFLEVDGKYFLNSEFYSIVSSLFQTEIEGSTLSNLELILGETYFEEIIFDVQVGDVFYRFNIAFDLIGTTEITLPSV